MAFGEARTSERHAVIERAVVALLGRFTDDDAHAMVDEDATADSGAGVNFNAGQVACQLADEPRQKKTLMVVQKMRNLVRDQHMKAGIQDNDLRHIARGGVFIADIFCIFPKAHSSFLLTSP